MKIIMDDSDYRILQILTENSRLSYAEIGRQISLSQSATKERVQNLLDNGVIKQFSVEIDYEKLGYPLKVVISLKFKNDEFRRFIEDVHQFPEILSCRRVTGEFCLITECVLKDSHHLERLIDRLIAYGIPTTAIQLSEIRKKPVLNNLSK